MNPAGDLVEAASKTVDLRVSGRSGPRVQIKGVEIAEPEWDVDLLDANRQERLAELRTRVASSMTHGLLTE